MRLDLFLKVSRLAQRRTVAAEMCKAGRVGVNDAAAKPGREIKPGDVIALKRRGEILRVRVESIPSRNVSKSQAASLYEILSVERCNELNDLLKSDNHEDRED